MPYPCRTPPNLRGTDLGDTGPGTGDAGGTHPRGKATENANDHEGEEEEDKQRSRTTWLEDEN